MARCCPPNKPHCNSAHADALGRDSDDACCSACTATCIDDHASLQAVFRVCLPAADALVLPSFCCCRTPPFPSALAGVFRSGRSADEGARILTVVPSP